MSAQYDDLKRRYELNYITIEQLRRWVAINQKKPALGITAEEFKMITGQSYN